MKKSKLVRNVSLVALSAVMACGTAFALAGCGGSKGSGTYELTVSIFCDVTDAATNTAICNRWAEEYTAKLRAAGEIPEGQSVKVTFTNEADRDTYFTQLDRNFLRNKAADIIYVQPRSVKTWVKNKRIMDLTSFIKASEGDEYEENVQNIKDIWPDVLAFYGYTTDSEHYSLGDSIRFYDVNDTLENGNKIESKDNVGFYTVDKTSPTQVGVYGLPKDYSNFSMGFNARYFTDALKLAYMTIPANQPREVKGLCDNPSNNTYKGGANDENVVTYARTGDYKITNPYTGEKIAMHATEGQPAPLINPGVPTRYRPYNFYAFPDYQSALNGGDPVAKAVNEYTRGQGYVVTIPGFPGDTFATPAAYRAGGANYDANAPYDTTIGHVVLTYAEYSALSWAVTYFCNTFNFSAIQDAPEYGYVQANGTVSANDPTLAKALKGTSGCYIVNGSPEQVFANEQYEGAPNPTLYLLPWLAGNDANFINLNSDVAINATLKGEMEADATISANEYDFKGLDITASGRLGLAKDQKGGTYTEKVPKLRLNGEIEEVDVEYGVNSERFIETFGAFQAYGSDWNCISGNTRVKDAVKDDRNGWALFRNGAAIFYGAGTWDSKTKNESPLYYENGDTFCEYRSVPIPVGEKYALYSSVKDGYYKMHTYGENKIYSEDEIIANLMERQDKWGARMDSVGFALNKQVETQAAASPEAAWKLQGAASLIMALSAQTQSQHDLLLGGAQLPNFKSQCVDFLNYQNDTSSEAGGKNYVTDGAFSDMITPEGFATTPYYTRNANGDLVENAAGVAEAKAIWKAYFSVVEALNTAAQIGSADRTKTVQAWMNEKYPNGVITGYKYPDASDGGAMKDVPLRWDSQFANLPLAGDGGALTMSDMSFRASAMKVLKMTTYTYADRDMQLRMQYGVNAVRDCAMYTWETGWINDISMRDGAGLAYRNQLPLQGNQTLASIVTSDINTPDSELKTYQTPAFFCFYVAEKVQQDLETSIKNEEIANN